MKEILSITKALVKKLPQAPGVYLIKDSFGKIIYIGKAKNLRARVNSYFSKRDTRLNVTYILAKGAALETIITKDERQALVLESDLIKKHKPKYNIMLKDDKAHLIVRIDLKNKWPRIELVRRQKADSAVYFGPFPFSHELRNLLDTIKNTIPLRTCTDAVLNNRVRPCLEYQIKRCLAPCCLPVTHEQYIEGVKQAILVLKGKNKEVAATLKQQIDMLCKELRFEEAAILRDRLKALKKVTDDHLGSQISGESIDCIAFYKEQENFELTILSLRQGRIQGSQTFSFLDVKLSDEEFLSSALTQYYLTKNEIPGEILIPLAIEDRDIQAELYSEIRGKKVTIACPERGGKARLLEIAEANARESFSSRVVKKQNYDILARQLQEAFALDSAPRVIECIDISHSQGKQTVGSVVCFIDGKPEKSRYRHFYLSQEGKPDDFASIKETTARHLSRGVEENSLADLIIIDGGSQQLTQALNARSTISGHHPAMIALAKKRAHKSAYPTDFEGEEITLVPRKPERVFLENNEHKSSRSSVILQPGSDVLNILEKIRDEAHRFAITFHRQNRNKQSLTSTMDDIPGLSSIHKQKLLKKFGSISGIKKASVEQIATTLNITEKRGEYFLSALKTKQGGAK